MGLAVQMPGLYCGHVEARRRRAYDRRRRSLWIHSNNRRDHDYATHCFHSHWVEDLCLWQGEDIGAVKLDRRFIHGCTERSAPGVLALGQPKSLTNCPMGSNSIVVSSLPQGDAEAESLCPAITVNDLSVRVLPCGGTRDKGIVQYLVPALGIEAVGTGTKGEDVAGTGTGTIVGQALHTLR